MKETSSLLHKHHPESVLHAHNLYYTIRHHMYVALRYRSMRNPIRTRLEYVAYILEIFILIFIILNVFLAILDASVNTDPAQPHATTKWYQMFLMFSTTTFSFEYALRFWSCVEDTSYDQTTYKRITWMLKPMSLIDLLSLIPFYLEIASEYTQLTLYSTYRGAISLRSLRLLRILSIIRLERYYNAMQNLRIIFSRKKEELFVISYLTAVIVLISSTIIYFLENEAQPNVFTSVGKSAWWSIETITSLGYGDIVPVTNAGRIFASILALWGIILFTIPGAILATGFIELMLDKHRPNGQHSKSLTCDGSTRLDETHAKLDQLLEKQNTLQLQMSRQQAQLEALAKLLQYTLVKPEPHKNEA